MRRCGARGRSWLTLVLLLGLVRTSLALQLTRGPYLQHLTGTSVTVVWNTDIASGCSLGIRPVPGSVTTIAGRRGTVCAVDVAGLRPGTRYGYVPYGNGIPLAAESVFETDDPAAPFVFGVLGDSGTASSAQFAVRDRMLAGGLDLIVHTGDQVYDSGAVADQDPRLFAPYKDLLRRIVFWPDMGNHDYRNPSVWRDVWYTPANNAAGDESYYSFDRGAAHFVVLNSNISTGPGSAQYRFLDQDLAASAARWKFVFFHHTIYSGGEHGSNTAIRADLVPVFDRHHVDVVFMGHDHTYQRTEPLRDDQVVTPGQGTVYVTTGGGGADLYDISVLPVMAYTEKAHHYVRVAVDGTLHLEMVRADGDVRDTLDIVKGGTSTTTTTPSRPSVTSTTRPATTTTTLVPLPTPTPSPGTSLVNGGFEQGETGWLGWTSTQNAGEAVLTTVEPCGGRTGLHMFDSASRTRSVFQDVTVEGGQSIALRFLARARNLGAEQARAVLEWRNEAGALGVAVRTLPAETYGCTGFALEARAPAGATSVRVSLRLGPVTDRLAGNDAEVWYDEVGLGRSASDPSSTTTTSTVPSTTTTTLPRPTSCLGGAGPLSVDTGTHASRVTFGEKTLKPGLRIDARGATFLASMSNLHPLVLDRGGRFFLLPERQEPPNVCVAGGTLVGQFPRSETWTQSKAHAGAGIEFWPGDLTIEGARIDNVHDGIRPMDGNNWTIRGAHLSYIRDDCVENDHMRSGRITDSLFDGCYVFVSTRPSSTILSEGWDGTNEVVRVENSLVHMQPMPGPVTGTLDPGWGTTWKWHTGTPSKSPRLSLHRNIFRYDQVGGSGAASLQLPPGKLLDCSDNVVVWLGPGEFPARLPSCFKVTKDPAVWNKAVAAWKARHP